MNPNSLPSLAESILDSLSVNLALLDAEGTIIYTNSSWDDFGQENNLPSTYKCIGVNYVELCKSVDDPFAQLAADGIQDIVDGQTEEYELEYPCHTEDEQQWFILKAERCQFGDQNLVLVSHYDITGRRLSEIQTRRFSRVVEEIPLGLLVLKFDGNSESFTIQEFNPFGQALMGKSAEDLIGKKLIDVFPGIKEGKLYDGLLDVVQNQRVLEIEGYQALDPETEDKFWDIKVFSLTENTLGLSFENVTEDVEAREKLEYIATHDELTGLLDRSYLLDRFSEEFTRAERYDRDLSIILLDLDDFKKVNDDYGHLAGDEVLSRVGEMLSDTVRESDIIGRYGGEEFCLVLPETTVEEAIEFAERIRKTIEKLEFETDRDEPFAVTASVGVTERQSTDEEIRQMIGRADRALYQAKDRGKNQVIKET